MYIVPVVPVHTTAISHVKSVKCAVPTCRNWKKSNEDEDSAVHVASLVEILDQRDFDESESEDIVAGFDQLDHEDAE